MRAAVLDASRRPLSLRDRPAPEPGPGQVLLDVRACAVCRTDLHIVDGDLPRPKLPLVPGHEIVGAVVRSGAGAHRFAAGHLVGVPWLGWTCGTCRFCRSGRENLCDRARFTGYDLDGGYAELAVADERYCFSIPPGYDPVHAAPLLCAGLIGYRSLAAAGEAERLGLYGFGASAHIIAQVARHQGRRVFAFTRPGDAAGQAFARELGAEWAGGSDEQPPAPLDAAIIFASAGELVPGGAAGGRARAAPWSARASTCRRSRGFPTRCYGASAWSARWRTSPAGTARTFFGLAASLPLAIAAEPVPLAQANDALDRLRTGRVAGALVLVP